MTECDETVEEIRAGIHLSACSPKPLVTSQPPITGSDNMTARASRAHHNRFDQVEGVFLVFV